MIYSVGKLEQPLDHRFTREPDFPHWTFGIMYEGSSHLTTDHGEITHPSQSIGYIKPGTPYSARFGGVGKRWVSSWVVFDPRDEWIPLLNYPEELPGIHRFIFNSPEQLAVCNEIFMEMQSYFFDSFPEKNLFAMNLMEKLLLTAHRMNPLNGEHDIRVAKAKHYLLEHLKEKVLLQDLADLVNLSPSRFSALFKRNEKMSVFQYFDQLKIQKAKSLLFSSNNLNINQIASEIGYDNPFHFTKRFKQITGMSPTKYREKATGSPA